MSREWCLVDDDRKVYFLLGKGNWDFLWWQIEYGDLDGLQWACRCMWAQCANSEDPATMAYADYVARRIEAFRFRRRGLRLIHDEGEDRMRIVEQGYRMLDSRYEEDEKRLLAGEVIE